VEPGYFEIVRDAFEGFVAGVGGRRNIYVHSRGLKVGTAARVGDN